MEQSLPRQPTWPLNASLFAVYYGTFFARINSFFLIFFWKLHVKVACHQHPLAHAIVQKQAANGKKKRYTHGKHPHLSPLWMMDTLTTAFLLRHYICVQGNV